MASSSCCCHHFKSPTPHFFKVILPQTLTDKKLHIPKKFVRKHGEALQSEEVRLKVASGAEWKVGVTKTNENVWFEKGWQHFAKFYSVECGHFLIFRFEGNSSFHVIIFDQTALEIEYPMAFGDFDKNKVLDEKITSESEEFEDDECVEILGNNKRMKLTSDHQACANMAICRPQNKEKMLMMNGDLHYFSEFKDLKPLKAMKSEKFWIKRPSTATQQARITEEKASKFKSMTANPSFMVKIGPSYIHTGRCCLCIPKAFANIYLKESKDIILQVSDGRVWKTWCSLRLNLGTNKFEIRDGWKAFARDNSLKEGDICVFELIENAIISFKVTIFRPT